MTLDWEALKVRATSNQKSVRSERTGWRDAELSKRHRDWGWDCPAIDIDFLMVEYNMGKPIAIVEYKHELAQPINLLHPSYLALSELAAKAEICFFVVRYTPDFLAWYVTPIGEITHKYLAIETKMTELEWVTLLYKLRGLLFNKNQLTL